MEMDRIVNGLFWFLAFLFSTTVHEAAHAFLALRGGDATAYQGGQVSLSPIPHIRREPIGMLAVPLITAFMNGWSIGWASTPFDPHWAARYPRRAALMSLAGPAANLGIALLAWIGIRVGLSTGFFEQPMYGSQLVVHAGEALNSAGAFVAKALSVLVTLNVFLAAFNLLPLPPMDGASVVVGFLPRDLADRASAAMRNPIFSIVGLIVAWRLFRPIAEQLQELLWRSLYG
jgi:Zn-dependent protease